MDTNGVNKNNRIEKKCRNCGIIFSIPKCRDWREHCCSSECKKAVRDKGKEIKRRECKSCGNVFYPRIYQIKSGEGNYCSIRCFYDSRIGIKDSEETKLKRVQSFLKSEYNLNRPRGNNHPNFKQQYIQNGYIYITNENGMKVMEHRYVMEKHLGRKLKSHEVVHHIDRNKTNNLLSNLQVMTKAEHAKEHADEKPQSKKIVLDIKYQS